MAAPAEKITARDVAPDFSTLHSSGLLPDITVVIREEAVHAPTRAPRAKRARTRSEAEDGGLVVPAHRVVLWSLSTFFQAKVIAGSRILPFIACMQTKS